MLCSVILLTGCGAEAPAPYAEAVIEVDTNLSVPGIASRLRVDIFNSSGQWYESSDLALPTPESWPISFSVYSPDEQRETSAWVRLRAYPEAGVRNYEGEAFWDVGAPWPAVAAQDGPRLVRDGQDITPTTEPNPLVAVDRLLLVALRPGKRGTLEVLLDGACAGTMARLANDPSAGPRLGEAESCVSQERFRELVEPSSSQKLGGGSPSQAGQFNGEACPEQEVAGASCIPGGATIFGSQDLFLIPDLAPVPERIVALRRFWLDRQEVSVARYREAVQAGFLPPTPPNSRNLELGSSIAQNCTYSDEDLGREAFALSCIDWESARALCQFFGGDLPTEAQWEYAASLTGGRSRYPWGNAAASCDGVQFGRAPLAANPGFCEETQGFGPKALQGNAQDTSPLGVQGLGGSVAEWCLDSYAEYASDCWLGSPNSAAGCFNQEPGLRAVRGGSWVSPPPLLRSQARQGAPAQNRVSFIGVRCAYAEAP